MSNFKEPKYYTIWKVIDAEDNILFEGKFGAAENHIKENNLENAKLKAFMYEHEHNEIEETNPNEQ